jgi:site-specific recombinase XerD
LSPSTISARVKDLMVKAGIKHPGQRGVGAHALRHTCASDVLDRCNNVRTVQNILGHASLATTELSSPGEPRPDARRPRRAHVRDA